MSYDPHADLSGRCQVCLGFGRWNPYGHWEYCDCDEGRYLQGCSKKLSDILYLYTTAHIVT